MCRPFATSQMNVNTWTEKVTAELDHVPGPAAARVEPSERCGPARQPDWSFHLGPAAVAENVRILARVDEILAQAERAGGTITKPAATLEWGGYGGCFADPDGYIWQLGYSAQGEDQPYAE